MTNSKAAEAVYTIEEAADRMGLTEQYVRALLRNKQLNSEMIPIVKGSKVKKHIISESEIVRFETKSRPHSRRKDGRNKYVVYATDEEMKQTKESLLAQGLTEMVELIKLANIVKNAPYMKEVSNESNSSSSDSEESFEAVQE